jgi:predicted RNA-binding Zn-ribbon protein involved in translation (DUF1610 family)
MTSSPDRRIWRSGVRFNCPECGRLWRDDADHAPVLAKSCAACGGDFRLVGKGDSPFVQDANWYRCLGCKNLYMRRRGEIVTTKPRSGFAEFTGF